MLIKNFISSAELFKRFSREYNPRDFGITNYKFCRILAKLKDSKKIRYSKRTVASYGLIPRIDTDMDIIGLCGSMDGFSLFD